MSKSKHSASITIAFVIALAFLVPIASAQRGTNGYVAEDFATGLEFPVGLAFDSFGNLFVMDHSNGYLYKFRPARGVVSAATRVSANPIPGEPAGLAFSKDWHLYLARQSGDVIELNQSTGVIIRTVAKDICGATGIATDPVSGDLFVSQPDCSSDIRRISKFASGPGVVTVYASPGAIDGLTFSPDGTLYAALYPRGIVKISGTNSAKPGTVTYIADVPSVDGIAIAADSTFLLGNRNDGKITKVGLTTSPPTLTDIFTGGGRGDFIAVGPDGCFYATQSSSVIKVTNADGSCSLAPTSAGTNRTGFPIEYLLFALCLILVLGVVIVVILDLLRRRKSPSLKGSPDNLNRH